MATIFLQTFTLLCVLFKQAEADCIMSESAFKCINEEQKSIIYQYHLKKTENTIINITAIEILNSSLPAIDNLLNSIAGDDTNTVREIKLNYCEIKEVSEDAFAKCDDLEVLNLSDNELESIDFLESAPKKLREIYLGYNKIREVPDTFSQLKSLEIIDFSHCNIENLDFTVFKNNSKLNLVNVSHNNIVSSESEEYLKNIKCVDLSYNNISNYSNIPSYCLDLSATNIPGYHWYNVSSRNKTVFIDTFFYSGNNHLRLAAFNKRNETLPIEIRYLNISNFSGKIPPDLELEQVKVRRELILRDSNIPVLERASYDFKPLFFDEGTNAYFDLSSCSISDISPLYFENYSLGRLNLCHNKFEHLRNSVFKDAYIIQLDLCNSTIKTIDEHAFHGLHTHTLNLSSNSIDELIFLEGIQDVHILDLSHNILKEIPPNSFSSLKNMKNLNLSYNSIETVGGTSLHNEKVEIIYLDHNRLQSIQSGTFQDLPNLREVYLQRNPISVIEVKSFDSLANLRFVNLAGMELSEIQPSAFNNLQSLSILRINDNKLTNLPAQIFSIVPNLRQLDLSGNSLERVDGLRGVSLEKLNITINERFQYDTLYIPTLRQIYIIDSNTQHFQNPGLYNLEELHFVNSPMIAIQPHSFSGFFKVKQMNEQDIFSRIEVIPQYAFRDMGSLVELDMSALFVKVIAPKAFVGLKRTENISLANNAIVVLEDYTFSGLDNLRSLDISQNEISLIGKKAFDSLQNVNIIRLNNNNLSVIPIGTFLNLRNLNLLDMSHNKIDVLEVGIFTSLDNLKVLDISNNQLQYFCDGILTPLVNLEHLNLKGNFISRLEATDILVHPRIRSVGIDGNKLDCNNLKDIVIALNRGNVSILPLDQSTYYSQNIAGIACKNVCHG